MIKINFARIRFWLFLALIIGMPLSKYPSVALPAYNFTSFRLGLYPLLAAIFALLCAWPAFLKTRQLFKQNKTAFISILVLAFVVIIGLFSAIDTSRSTLLAVSILFLLSLVMAGWWYVRFELEPNKYSLIWRCLIWGTIVYSVLAIIQFIAGILTNDTFGIACPGCTSDIFGFPRVNLFAAEPQFFANALLPFFFVSLATYFKKATKLSLVALILSAIAIGLTFSRGAYLAIVIGLITFFVLSVAFKIIKIKKILIFLGIVVICSIVSFGLMIAAASWRYRSTPNIARDTANTILEHMTLGMFSLPVQTSPDSQPSSAFVSPGLIESSTTDRTSAADLALRAWRSNVSVAVMGVGAGNLGPYVVNNIEKSAPSNLTVYIFYVLILAELGLIGLIAFIALHLAAFYQLIKRINHKSAQIYITFAAILAAFLAQYFFFGTYINTIYVWLSVGTILGLTTADKIHKL